MKNDEILILIQYRIKQAEERQVSDYQVFDPVTLNDAETALKRAEGFVEAVGDHLMPENN